ncbi:MULTISPECIES: glycosyltransferase family 4 protein [Bacillaceae]|uniref:Poly(Glycerol-phosphate) alpha-glucosyltransferase n=1 Tax=Caldibacillus thermoamylovorans TaxID=35841 RepID=A0ABD4A6F2_9BACI|nr:glycosyltransferase family 4 protein [Caldibacillus thermoamylovorans]KIO64070.1 Poly(glycerol-phosphate) alpha-glucosyltransferase [Caldibacillus thermoamylovorans]KIO72737.1 Poly(glycerol-phosphate) alpha-glucosyltransferase [Caldibacillus thermoamylovorans]
MNVLHLISGNETGGGMFHVLSLLDKLKNDINVTLGVFHDEEMAKRARNLGIDVCIFKQRSKFDLSIIKNINKYIEENNINIIHTHGARANFIAQFLSTKSKYEWFITVHSNPYDDFLNQGLVGKLFTRLNIRAIKSADCVLAISETFNRSLRNIGVSSEKIETILNGIDFNVKPKISYKREDYNLKEDDFVIMMVARLEPVKCHETALIAMRQLLTKSSKFQLIIVGDGSRYNELRKKTEELEISNNVKFLGQRDDIPELFTLGDITILTSKSESFPLVLLESARAKKPVISTNVGGVTALLPNENYGYIINVGDHKDLADKIWDYFIMKEKGELAEIGERLYKYASANFSDEVFARSVSNIYLKKTEVSNE